MKKKTRCANRSIATKDENMKQLSEDYIFHRIMNQKNNEIKKLLIYALYKLEKVEYLVTYKSIHGEKPSDEELYAFQKSKMDDEQIKVYEDEVKKILTNSFYDLLDEAVPQIISKKIDKIGEKIDNIKTGGFWSNVAQSVVVTFIVMGITIIVLLNTNLEKMIKIQEILKKSSP